MSKSQKQMERAFKLIKRDKTDEALKILRPVTESEPDNVDAWWLLAYAATEPREVREALVKVLRLDPEYTNAPKAREMLAKLNDEYPPELDEITLYPELQTSFFPDVFAADDDLLEDEFGFMSGETFAEASPGEATDPFAEDIFGDVFRDQPTAASEEIGDIFAQDDPFALVEGVEEEDQVDIWESVEADVEKAQPVTAITSLDFDETVDEETLAKREEKTYRRGERGRRIIRLGFAIVLVALVVVAALLALSIGEEDGASDLPELSTVSVESPQVQNVIAATENQLRAASLGSENGVVVAESKLGKTLYVETCGQAGPELPNLIEQSMELVSREAPALQNELDAVGINVTTCNGENSDVLYRAVVSVDDAARYVGGELGNDTEQADVVQARFQETWKKP
jgi:hypothetical protein